MKKAIKTATICVTAAFILLMTVIYMMIYVTGAAEVPQKSDVIIVLGCELYGSIPSPSLVTRLDKAVELFENGYGKYIITTGGQGRTEDLPEGEAMKQYLIERGIDGNIIFAENESTSTYENFKYIQHMMEEKGLKTAVIATSRFHIMRSLMIARSLGYEVSGAPADGPDMITELRHTLREGLAFIKFLILHK